MTGSFLAAWALFPLLLLAVCLGSGLLVRRISGGALSDVLVLPVGFALTVALCTLGTSITWLAPAAGWIALTVGLVGLALVRPRMRLWRAASKTFLYPATAAFVAFAVIAAPVVLTGTTTWTGWGRIVDTAFQMAFSQHLAEAGRSVPPGDSAFNETILGLTGNGYPGGAQATLGAIAGVIRTDVAWCYQAYLAWAAAMGALALYSFLRRVIAIPLLCCIGAAVAIQPNILYAYALEGGIKELTTASLILLVVAVLADWLSGERRAPRGLLPLAPSLAAAVAAFSYGILPWVGLLLLGGFALSLLLWRKRMLTVGSWAAAGLATGVLAVPSVISSIKLFGTAKEAVTGTVEVGLGNLTAPIPEISAVGVWISNDYRFPAFAHSSASHAFDIGIIVLASIGLLCALWRRRWMIAVMAIAAPIALAYWVAHSGPWVELKAYTITGTMIVAMAFVGAGWLAGSRVRRLRPVVRAAGWLAALAVAGAVLYGNALTYHDISVAPAARYHELAAIGKRFAGIGPAFFPSFDEYSEYFLRREHGYDLVRPPGLQVRAAAVSLAPGQFAFAYDFNQLELAFLEKFPLLIASRSPVASRAPANYDLVDRTPDFEVFRRTRPASDVFIHFPLAGLPGDRTRAFCRNLQAEVRRSGPGSSVAYVPSDPRIEMLPTLVGHPHYWPAAGPETLHAHGAGVIEGSVTLPSTGTYDISMVGSVGRKLTLDVDGRRVGSLEDEWRYPSQYLRFALTSLTGGRHAVRITRPNGNLLPGSGDGPDGNSGVIGPLTFTLQKPGAGQVVVQPGSEASRVCAAPVGYEWIEVLAPGAGTPPTSS
jgi:hypothetical protein